MLQNSAECDKHNFMRFNRIKSSRRRMFIRRAVCLVHYVHFGAPFYVSTRLVGMLQNSAECDKRSFMRFFRIKPCLTAYIYTPNGSFSALCAFWCIPLESTAAAVLILLTASAGTGVVSAHILFCSYGLLFKRAVTACIERLRNLLSLNFYFGNGS